MEPFVVDGNGALTERRWIGGQDVVFHDVDHVPDSADLLRRVLPRRR
ncbi:MAG TPA: hypothetical protein VIH06_10470 [Ilumatobacteraceae bacterium]